MVNYIEKLIDSKCLDCFVQPTKDIAFNTDTFVINFTKQEELISVHSFSLIRALKNQIVIYTILDHYLNPNGTQWARGQRKISSKSFLRFKQEIIGETVTEAVLLPSKDLIIRFDNGLELQMLVDYSKSKENDEIHRILIGNKKWSEEKIKHFVIDRE